MSTSAIEPKLSQIQDVTIGRIHLTLKLADGRAVAAPLDWFPRLKAGTPKERRNWEFIGAGFGVHWPDLDEDISLENILDGRKSMESDKSFHKWLRARKQL